MTGLVTGYSLVMPSSVVRVVRTDHGRLSRLLRRVVTPGPSQDRWRAELLALLQAHRAGERAVLGDDALAAAGPEVVEAARAMHALDPDLERCTRLLQDADPASPALTRAGHDLAALLDRHDALAGTLLDGLEAASARREVRALGGAYVAARDADLADHGVTGPPPRRLDLPRAELYEMARRAGIEGRSAMSRGQLITELLRRQPHH